MKRRCTKRKTDFQRWAGLHFNVGGKGAAATGTGGGPALGERYVSIVLRMPANQSPAPSSLRRQARFAHEINSPIRVSFGSRCGMTTFPSINGTTGINSNDFQIWILPTKAWRPPASRRETLKVWLSSSNVHNSKSLACRRVHRC